MKAVLDENVPRKLLPALVRAGCDVSPFPKSWRGLKNGRLLEAMRGSRFQCLVTCDKTLVKEQNLVAKDVAVVVLPTPALVALESIAESIAAAVGEVAAGQFIVVDG